jgi:hypothetical protein
MKKIVAVLLVCLTGCSGPLNKLHKGLNSYTSGNYHICVYSGSSLVREYHIENSFVNTEEHSDGWFFFNKGKLVRVSGTVVIEQE